MPETRIKFQCWFCNRRYSVSTDHAGERRICNCRQRIRIPRKSGGSCRDRTLVDWCVESAVYGGGCALFCFVLALFAFPRFMTTRLASEGVTEQLWLRVALATAVGFLIGALGGERAVNYFGRLIREYGKHS